jgi:hypothetical protein
MIRIKRLMTGLLKSRITRWSSLAVVLVAVALSLAASQRHYQLGGASVGGSPGFTWNTVLIPLDPAGRTAADRVAVTSWGAEFKALLDSFGADTVSDLVGNSRMISRDTAEFTHIGYAQKAGNPLQVRAILVGSGTFRFTGQDCGVVTYTMSVYPPTPDGFPNLNDPPLWTSPVTTDPWKSVPILQDDL